MAIAQNPQNGAKQGPSTLAVWAFLGAIFLAVQFASLFTPPLLDDVDACACPGRPAHGRKRRLGHLKIDGIRYIEKPPLPYWIVAVCYAIVGEERLHHAPAQRAGHVGACVACVAVGLRARGDVAPASMRDSAC